MTVPGPHADGCPSDECAGVHLPSFAGEVHKAYENFFGDEIVEVIEYGTMHHRFVHARHVRVQKGSTKGSVEHEASRAALAPPARRRRRAI